MKEKYIKLSIVILLQIIIVFLILFVGRSLVLNDFSVSNTRPLILSSCSVVISSCFSINKKAYYSSLMLAVLAFCSILYIKFFSQEVIYIQHFNYLVCFSIGIINTIFLIYSLFIDNTYIANVLLGLLLFICFLPTIFLWGYYFISESFVDADVMMAILQTNISEAKEYFMDSLTEVVILKFIVLVFMIFAISLLITQLRKRVFFKYSSIIITFLIVGNVYFAYRYRKNIVMDIFFQTYTYINRYQNFEKNKTLRNNNIKKQFVGIENKSKGVYVIVIGESQNKNQMSAYGYNRITTPWLDKEKNSKNFLLFNNAYSCHGHTVASLTYALTAKNQYNDIDLANSVSLIEVVEAAGFDTVWISNQVKYNIADTPITVIADESNQQFWYNDSVGDSSTTKHYDLYLLEALNKINVSDNMLIVFHLMGNHALYKERYPKEFREFGESNRIDTYDNSILYNDFVMQHLYEKVIKLPNFKGLIYFSDHAEAIKQDLRHDVSKFVFDMTHIPMYMYFTDEYIIDNKIKFLNLSKAQDYIYTNDLMFNTILGVMGIEVNSVYEGKNDITSEAYNNDINRFKTLYGKKNIIDDK